MQILTTIPDRGPYKNPENAKIVERFFIALESLITTHRIRGVKTFTDIYGINRMNLYQLKKDMGRGMNLASARSLGEGYGDGRASAESGGDCQRL